MGIRAGLYAEKGSLQPDIPFLLDTGAPANINKDEVDRTRVVPRDVRTVLDIASLVLGA